MCVISCILKCLLGIVNTLLLIMGIILLILGALLAWGFTTFLTYIYSIETQIMTFIKSMGIQVQTKDVIQLIALNATSIGYIAFAIGCLLVALGIIGIIALACCSLRIFLICITVILVALTLGLIVLIAYFGVNSTTQVITPILQFIQTNLIQKYTGFNVTSAESVLVNIIQITVHCCGLYNYTDYNNVPYNRLEIASNGTAYNISFPISCCNFAQDMTISSTNRDNCIMQGMSDYKNVGCWSTYVQPTLVKYLGYCFTSIGITIGILVAAIIVFSIFIHCAEKIGL